MSNHSYFNSHEQRKSPDRKYCNLQLNLESDLNFYSPFFILAAILWPTEKRFGQMALITQGGLMSTRFYLRCNPRGEHKPPYDGVQDSLIIVAPQSWVLVLASFYDAFQQAFLYRFRTKRPPKLASKLDTEGLIVCRSHWRALEKNYVDNQGKTKMIILFIWADCSQETDESWVQNLCWHMGGQDCSCFPRILRDIIVSIGSWLT